MGLWSVDADVADLLDSILDRHFDGVAVNDFENLGFENLGSPCTLRWAAPCCPQLLTGQADLLARKQQAALDRVEHRLGGILWQRVDRYGPVLRDVGPGQ